jgi:non-ribosomal peptide synthetase component F
VALALSRFVAETRCPISLPKHKGVKGSSNGKEGKRDRWAEAAAMRRESLIAWMQNGGAAEYDHPGVAHAAAEQFSPIEDRIDMARAAAEIRRILAVESEAAKAVLLAEEKSAEVAKRLSLSRREVYEQTAQAMRALRAAFLPEDT